MPLLLPCGQCAGCRLERSRQWAMRCVHEASEYDANCFITLTVQDKDLYRRYVTWHKDRDLYYSGSLDKSAFPKFMKRLRKEIHPHVVRYYHCGEYGSEFGRPHYHACLFGFDFPDKVQWGERNHLPVWRSEVLERLWPFGQCEIGTMTFESAAYVARYIMKKITGRASGSHYRAVCLETGEELQRTPEYTTMSRRPGIGRRWFDKWASEVYQWDEVPVRGKMARPPRFYDKLYELEQPLAYDGVMLERFKKECANREAGNYHPDRVRAAGVILDAEISLYERGVE